MNFVGSIVLLFFALVWCGFLGFVDSQVLPPFIKQLRTADFTATTAWVTGSDSTPPPLSEGKKSPPWTVTYHYDVAGKEFVGDRTSFGTMTFGNGRQQAKRLAEEFPVGKQVPVFYNPTDPGEAVLKPGLLPDHLILALFFIPHHLVGFLLLCTAFAPLLRKLHLRPERFVLRPIDDLRVSMRMPWLRPWTFGLAAFGAASFVSVFIVPFVLPMPPTMIGAVGVWGVLITFGIVMAQRRRKQLDAGFADLTIDANARSVVLPVGMGRDERVTMPFDHICGVAVRRLPAKTVRTTEKGWTVNETHKTPTWELSLIGPSEQPLPLGRSTTEGELEKIAETLSQTFGWPDQRRTTSSF